MSVSRKTKLMFYSINSDQNYGLWLLLLNLRRQSGSWPAPEIPCESSASLTKWRVVYGLGEKQEPQGLVFEWIDQSRAVGTVSLCLGADPERQNLYGAQSDLEVSWVVLILPN